MTEDKTLAVCFLMLKLRLSLEMLLKPKSLTYISKSLVGEGTQNSVLRITSVFLVFQQKKQTHALFSDKCFQENEN